MANLIITNKCNLKCKYCFAKETCEMPNEEMTDIQLANIIKWFKGSGDHLNLIGGEPTIHSDFGTMLRMALRYSDYKNTVTVFTNGVKLEEQLINNSSLYNNPNVLMLLNLNSPEAIGQPQYESILRSVDIMKKKGWINNRLSVGCNIFLVDDISYYDYIFEFIKKYNIKILRVSAVSPAGEFVSYRNSKEDYFIKLKPIYIDFLKELKELGCNAYQDCSYIPRCYFNDDDIKVINAVGLGDKAYNRTCINPVLDVYPNGDVVSCFGGGGTKLNIFDFQNTKELKAKFIELNKERLTHQDEKCQSCDRFKNGECQGGCLGFIKE